MVTGTSLVAQWLRLYLPMQEVWFRSLGQELRYHMPGGQKKTNIKWKQYCNKFNKKTLKMVLIKKNSKRKIMVINFQFNSVQLLSPI